MCPKTKSCACAACACLVPHAPFGRSWIRLASLSAPSPEIILHCLPRICWKRSRLISKTLGARSRTQAIQMGNGRTLLRVCNFVDAGSSRLLSAQVHEDFHAETAFDAIVTLSRRLWTAYDVDPGSGCPLGRPRYPARFSLSFASIPVLCWGTPQYLAAASSMPLNCYVERYNKSYKQGCILVYRPTTVEEVRTVTEHFQQHYNLERPRSVTQLSQSPTGCGSSRLADPSHLTRECRS